MVFELWYGSPSHQRLPTEENAVTDSREPLDSPSRPGAARRADNGVVAGYIHELSERHDDERRDGRRRRQAGSSSLDEEGK
jgi:hypothetical protein